MSSGEGINNPADVSSLLAIGAIHYRDNYADSLVITWTATFGAS